jgi:hypothetical protein
MFRRFVTFVVVFVITLATVATAQNVTGVVGGLVRDSLGGAIPGATVRAINDASGTSVEAVSDGQGAYRFVGLPSGEYRVEAALDGFETATRKVVLDAGQTAAIDMTLAPARINEGVVVTARRVEEVAQEVPIPVSVLSGELVANAGAFNVNRVKELIPSVQFYSSNPRNSSVNIRGLGAPFGLTNDGIEPGVGLYVDGVFYARPAAATLDFLDVERVEVLRGPQGTLFGKNATAGAINVTSRRPGFKRETEAEFTYGSFNSGESVGLGSSEPEGRRACVLLRYRPPRLPVQYRDRRAYEFARQPGRQGPIVVRAVNGPRRESGCGSHAATSRWICTGDHQRCADPASGESTVCANRCRSRVYAAEFQCLRSARRHRHALAIQPGSRRHLVDG